MRNLIICLFLLALAGVCYGEYILESWETDPGYGSDANYIWPGYVGVTHGDYSLGVIQSGWGQPLTIKLQDKGSEAIDAFMANDKISIDFSLFKLPSFDIIYTRL